jgi:hypothetical protein
MVDGMQGNMLLDETISTLNAAGEALFAHNSSRLNDLISGKFERTHGLTGASGELFDNWLVMDEQATLENFHNSYCPCTVYFTQLHSAFNIAPSLLTGPAAPILQKWDGAFNYQNVYDRMNLGFMMVKNQHANSK